MPDLAPHGISEPMRRVLAEIVARRKRGFTLSWGLHWRWAKGGTKSDQNEPAPGITITIVGALIRRGYVRHHPAPDWFHLPTYHVTQGGRLALRRANRKAAQEIDHA